ncbi:ABC transporter permease subunit [Lentibacillus sp. N15]|uniref:ABC transporter permease subunit n=1 Tax=Lentibacillus songyuanensis TaxID=3136161 RepID=UPI0031BA0A51
MAYIWKEYLEQIRGKGLWLGLGIFMLTSLFIIADARSYPDELGFEAMLLSVFDMNLYIIPLFSLFLSSFSIFQEKELKTEVMLLTKKESFFSFLLKKSMAVQIVMISAFLGAFLILAIFMKLFLQFHVLSFLTFLLVITVLLLIFNQIGVFLGILCKTRMQLVGANILSWFIFIFLIDLVFLYILPAVSFENIQLFAWTYFLDPLHSLRFYLETDLGLYGLTNLSHVMKDFMVVQPVFFLFLNMFIWPVLFFALTVFVRRGGVSYD